VRNAHLNGPAAAGFHIDHIDHIDHDDHDKSGCMRLGLIVGTQTPAHLADPLGNDDSNRYAMM